MIESGYYDSTAGMDPGEIKAVVFGIPGSGSTYVWQLVADLIPSGVIKTHHYLVTRPDVPVFCTLRHPLDAMISNHRMMTKSDKPPTEEQLYHYAAEAQMWYWILEEYIYSDQPCKRPTHLIYFGHNPPEILLEHLCFWLGDLPLSSERRRQILESHSLEVNRKLCSSVSGDYDRNTLLHRGHVHESKSNTYKRFLQGPLRKRAFDLFSQYLDYWGYNGE